MFIIKRIINGKTDILKNSSDSHTDKIFSDYYSAELLVKQLNENIIPPMHWSVCEVTYVNNENKSV